jgi:ATP-binding cassette subfamily B protein
VGSALPPAVAWVGKALVDTVVARAPDAAARWVGIELALVAATVLASRSGGLMRQTLGAKLGQLVNVRVLEKALSLDLADFEDPSFYDQLTRARREASSRPLQVVTQLFDMAKGALTLSGYAALLLSFSPWVCLALAGASIPATISEVYFGRLAFRMRNWRSPDTRKLFYLERVLATDDYAKEVKLLGVGPLLLERYRTLGERIIDEDAKLASRRFRWGTVLSLAATAVYYGAYATMVIAAANGKMTLGEMTMYAIAFRQGQDSLQSVLSGLGGMHEHALYLSNLYTYLDRPATSDGAKPTPRTDGEANALARPAHLELRDVSFKYPGTDRWAVRNVSLDIPAGKSLALVGHNGSGKTTLIKLLLGLYTPTEGHVLLDGRDVASIPEEERRATYSVVFQDFARFQLTLRENVGFGSPDRMDDAAHVTDAFEKGGGERLMKKLPEGIESQLGKWFEKGVELSGGEWQAVALGRAFARDTARVLVLDEPTAALDAAAEHAVFERFRELTRGKTALLISHRLPTVRMADRIVVLEGGELRESGTHDELVKKGGLYASLFELQASGYR